MSLSHHQRIAFAITALLFSSLACRAATRLIIPDTPTPQPTSTTTPIPTFTPTLPPSVTPTSEYTASCPLMLDEILEDATSSGGLFFSDEEDTDADVEYLVHYTVVDDELKTPLF